MGKPERPTMLITGYVLTHPGCKEKETADALGIGLEYAASRMTHMAHGSGFLDETGRTYAATPKGAKNYLRMCRDFPELIDHKAQAAAVELAADEPGRLERRKQQAKQVSQLMELLDEASSLVCQADRNGVPRACCWKTLGMLAEAEAKALQGRSSMHTNGYENRHEEQDFTARKAFRQYMRGEA